MATTHHNYYHLLHLGWVPHVEKGHHDTNVKCLKTTLTNANVVKKTLDGLSSHRFFLMKEGSVQHFQCSKRPYSILFQKPKCPAFISQYHIHAHIDNPSLRTKIDYF